MKNTIKGVGVTPSQIEVYNVLKNFPRGLPDQALVPVAQHASGARLSSSGIRTRRKELTDLRLVKPTTRKVRTGSGRMAQVYKVV